MQNWLPSPLSGMTKCQVDMENQCWECTRQFDSLRHGKCPHCGTYINSSMSRHVMIFHLDLGQLWRCPIPWCSVWKGTAQDCVDHLYLQHLVDRYRVFADSVPHQSLLGLFMTKLSAFTHQASAEARLVAKCGRDSSAESTPPPLQHAQTPDTSDTYWPCTCWTIPLWP